MQLLLDKFKETLFSVLPVVAIVLLLSLFIVEVSYSMMGSFLLGTFLLIIGLTIFLYGIETGMEPVGTMFGKMIAESISNWIIAFISFILGFAVTIAEPDLIILGRQIENATDGILISTLVVFFGVYRCWTYDCLGCLSIS